ncbi:hypothetical protein VW35_15825 [Devosia soli]|uniref:Uncharacterized protein n=1 Tax=Devosia soli TaxID=361041 RepID=A0A0F5L3G6_9HYPH|nr:hypothetical protein [Devosia soli]KKB76961.1 hypothetical protein VW35_15825 [Devosia soli]
MTQIAFFALCLAGLVWFWARKKTDPVAVAFASALIYFAPGFFGWASIPVGNGASVTQQLASETYLVMALVIAAIVATTFAVDRIQIRALSVPQSTTFVPTILLGVVVVGTAMSLSTVGVYYLCEKNVMLAQIDGWYYLASYALPLAAVSGLITRQYWIMGIAALFLMMEVYIGFRTGAAITLIGAAMLSGHRIFQGGRQAAIVISAILACGVALFLFPQVAYTLKYLVNDACPIEMVRVVPLPATPLNLDEGQVETLFAHLGTAAPYLEAILHSEPFIIQSVLNSVIDHDFTTDASYLLLQIATGIPGAVTIFGLPPEAPVSFNQMFQPVLFPDMTYGMANSPWAQAYAAGGLPMVGIFVLSFVILLGILNVVFTASAGTLKGVVAVVATWLAFYFHRNDLLAEVGILKQVIYTSISAFIIAAAVWAILRMAHRGKDAP